MITHVRNCGNAFFVCLMVAICLSTASISAQQFFTLSPPGAGFSAPGGINDLGQVVGFYYDGSGNQHGYVLTAGVYTTIDYPGAVGTSCNGINNNGVIVGSYIDNNSIGHGFTFINSTFTLVDDPALPGGTFPSQISDQGLIAGTGYDSLGNLHGFTYANNTFTPVDYPGSNSTQVLDMSFNGLELVGVYSLPSFPAQTYQGYTYMSGTFNEVTYPGSASTALNGVTNSGLVVGTYVLPNQTADHVFFSNGNTYTTEDFPGAASSLAANMNDLGEIVGIYYDASNNGHGFLMTTGPFAYAANFNSGNVSMIDILTSLPVATIPVGSGPWGVALSPDGKQLYVSNYLGNTVSVIDTATSTVIATIPVQSSPSGLAFSPDGTAVFVANGGSSNVSVINTASQTVSATIPVQSTPVGIAMAVTTGGTFAYVTNSGSNNVSVISVSASPSVVATINVGSSPRWAAVSPNNSMVYVENYGGGNVSAISVASNTVSATIPVGSGPHGAAFSPDSSTAYVTNLSSNSVSVINTGSNTVLNTIPGFSSPVEISVTPDGSSAYVTNSGNNTVAVVNTASDTITTTVPVGTFPIGVAMAAAPATTLQVTQPLSPTQPNTFGFGSNNYVVQYPAGSNFSGINMTVTAVEITPAQFAARVAGGPFSGATCIVYSGTGGNCVDYEVTCSDTNGNQVSCPSETAPTIAVQTSFETLEQIVNPGFLTTPIGQNQWTNIFSGYSDPTVKGKTQGFSEFVAVNLAVTNPQGAAGVQVLKPNFPVTYSTGPLIQLTVKLSSVTTGKPMTNAQGSLSVVMVADGKGNPTQQTIFSKLNCFKQTDTPGVYKYNLQTNKFPAGTYSVTIYGDSFAAQEGQFKILQ